MRSGAFYMLSVSVCVPPGTWHGTAAHHILLQFVVLTTSYSYERRLCCLQFVAFAVCAAAPPDGLTLSARLCVMAFEGCTGREWCTRVLWQREEVSDGGERTSSTIDGRPRASARKFIGVLPTCD